jgi:SusE-like outer membrane protein
MKPIFKLAFKAIQEIKIIHSLLIIFVLLLGTACKKELKAGDPMTLTYDKVYMIGDATPASWTIGNAVPMTKSSANEFTWTGPLTAGEIKFPTAMSFSSDTFGAATAGQAITNNKAQILPNGNPDVKWKLTSAEAGNYKVTVNTKDVTVTFQKQ